MTELTVREMPEVLIWVEACLWKMFGVVLDVEVLSSPLRWTAYSPDGTSANVTRKAPLPTDWREQPESDATDLIPVTEQSLATNKVLLNVTVCFSSGIEKQKNMPAVSL